MEQSSALKKALKMDVTMAHLTWKYLVPRTAVSKVAMMGHQMGNYLAPPKVLKMVAMMAEKRDFS